MRCSGHVPPVGDPGEDPGHAGETMSLGWPGNASGSPGKSWTKWLGRGKSELLYLGCCSRDPTPDKAEEDGTVRYGILSILG